MPVAEPPRRAAPAAGAPPTGGRPALRDDAGAPPVPAPDRPEPAPLSDADRPRPTPSVPAFLAPPPADDPDGFAALLAKVTRERGFLCRSYKERCLRRRVAVRMRACAVHTFADYMAALDADPAEYDRLLDALTINVTKLFRNWEAWESLAREVVPQLWARVADRPVRLWSAGTASGEEVYSLAALLHAHAEARGETDRLARVEIVGSDVDAGALAAAARGVYGDAAFADAPPALRARYFADGAPGAVSAELRRLVRLVPHDLLREPALAGPWDLVACRNVVIYFDREAQEALFDRLRAALAPGGVLFLGKVETLLGPARSHFATVVARDRLFRRLG